MRCNSTVFDFCIIAQSEDKTSNGHVSGAEAGAKTNRHESTDVGRAVLKMAREVSANAGEESADE